LIKPKKHLVAILILSVLLCSVYVSLLPAAHAAEPNLQVKSLSFLDNIVGVKTGQYTITQSTLRDTKSLDAPQKEVDFNLVSAGSSVRVTCTYTKNTLQFVYLSDVDGQHRLCAQLLDAG
jgi:hypothetical protein